MDKRKIIQISNAQRDIVALCDDGTLWLWEPTGELDVELVEWVQLSTKEIDDE